MPPIEYVDHISFVGDERVNFFSRLEKIWVSRNTPNMVTRTDYGAALIFSIGVLAAPAILVFAAYQSGVHEFFDPGTLSTVTAYAPYGGQVVGMVASIAFFALCYVFVLWGLIPATRRRYTNHILKNVCTVLLVILPVIVAPITWVKPTPTP